MIKIHKTRRHYYPNTRIDVIDLSEQAKVKVWLGSEYDGFLYKELYINI